MPKIAIKLCLSWDGDMSAGGGLGRLIIRVCDYSKSLLYGGSMWYNVLETYGLNMLKIKSGGIKYVI